MPCRDRRHDVGFAKSDGPFTLKLFKPHGFGPSRTVQCSMIVYRECNMIVYSFVIK